jgi:Macrocin-O-methyltransferase (TylF)
MKFIRNIAKKCDFLVKIHTSFVLLKQVPLNKLKDIERLRLFLKVCTYSMVSYYNLSCTYELARTAEQYKILGAFVECGVWRGGSAAVMAYVAHKAGNNRKVHLFDSFEGLPEPNEKDGIEARIYAENKAGGKLSSIGKCVGRYEDVIYLFFSILKLRRENIIIHKGWFQETMPKIKDLIGPIAILRLDADWHESTKVCLDYLYDSVVSGGFVIIDDYNAWEGCKKAVDEFLTNKKIKVEMVKIDQSVVYFQKPLF